MRFAILDKFSSLNNTLRERVNEVGEGVELDVQISAGQAERVVDRPVRIHVADHCGVIGQSVVVDNRYLGSRTPDCFPCVHFFFRRNSTDFSSLVLHVFV